MIDHYSSDEDNEACSKKQTKVNSLKSNFMNCTQEVSQLSSTLPSIEDIESSGDVPEHTRQDPGETHVVSEKTP